MTNGVGHEDKGLLLRVNHYTSQIYLHSLVLRRKAFFQVQRLQLFELEPLVGTVIHFKWELDPLTRSNRFIKLTNQDKENSDVPFGNPRSNPEVWRDLARALGHHPPEGDLT